MRLPGMASYPGLSLRESLDNVPSWEPPVPGQRSLCWRLALLRAPSVSLDMRVAHMFDVGRHALLDPPSVRPRISKNESIRDQNDLPATL